MKISKLIPVFLVMVLAGTVSATLDAPSSVKVESGNSFFDNYDGKVVVFEWSADKFDSSQVTVQPEDVNGGIKGEITEPVTLDLTSKTSKAKYKIRDGGRNDLKEVNYIKGTWSWGTLDAPSESERRSTYKSWANDNCEDVNGDGEITWYINEYYTDYYTKLNAEVWCSTLSSNEVANIGEIESTPQEVMGATFELSVNGDTVSKTITNSYTGSDDSGQSATFSNFAKINLQGGLVAPYSFPQPDDELIGFNNDKGNLILFDESVDRDYPNIKSNADTKSNLKDIAIQSSEYPNDEAYYENLYNGNIRNLFSKYSSSEFYNENLKFDQSDRMAGTLTITGDRMANYPQFQVIVKADKVGYFIPDATPEIVGTTSPTVKEGTSSATIDVDVKNVGNGQADFVARVTSCSKEFTASDTNEELSPSPGEVETASLPVSFNSGSYDSLTVSGSCTVEVENLRDNTETVSTEVSLTGEQDPECTKGSEFPGLRDSDGDGKTEAVILECTNGVDKEVKKVCGDSDKYRAKEVSPGDYKCEKTDVSKEVCGNGNDDDQDGKVDENCGEGTVTRWTPNSEQTQCVQREFPSSSVPENSFQTKDSCQSFIGKGGETCLINTGLPDLNPADAKKPKLKLLCMNNSTFNKIKFILLLAGGLLGGFAGFQAGSYFDGERNIRGRFNPAKSRSVSRMKRSRKAMRQRRKQRIRPSAGFSREQLIGAGLGITLGAGVAWYLGIWGTVGLIGLLLLAKYLVPGY